MEFRTEIERVNGGFEIGAENKILLLGSCFSESIGMRLADCGFDVMVNPMGTLYNPESIARMLERRKEYGEEDLVCHNGIWHCLDMAARYSDTDAERLLERVNRDWSCLWTAAEEADVMVITFGTTRVYRHKGSGEPVGNCHRLPACEFEELNLTTEEIVARWSEIDLGGKRVIFTLSPIRYTAYGLAANALAKATLRVAIEEICLRTGAEYFPAYEMMTDDLRDYRFYAADMKHPSDTAVEYIFEHFADAYFSEQTKAWARIKDKESRRQRHNPDYHSR